MGSDNPYVTSEHKALVERAGRAIHGVYSDVSVSVGITLASLRALEREIIVLRRTLEKSGDSQWPILSELGPPVSA